MGQVFRFLEGISHTGWCYGFDFKLIPYASALSQVSATRTNTTHMRLFSRLDAYIPQKNIQIMFCIYIYIYI